MKNSRWLPPTILKSPCSIHISQITLSNLGLLYTTKIRDKTYNIKATVLKILQQAAHTRPDATHIILSKIGRVVFSQKEI